MEKSIPKNPKSISILNKLISSGCYIGFVGSDCFELKRNHFPNNFRILGKLVEGQRFEIKSDFTKRLKYLVQLFNVMGITVALFLAFIQSNWIVTIIYFTIRLISHLYTNLKFGKEMRIFSSKYLEFEQSAEI